MAENTETPSEQSVRRAARQKDESVSGKIGRGLGRLVGRAKKTDLWTRTEQAYRDGLDGKP